MLTENALTCSSKIILSLPPLLDLFLDSPDVSYAYAPFYLNV